MHLTDEGYLVCRDVPIARTGNQVYYEHEVPPLQGDSGGRVHVARDASEVFKPQSVATFEGKPIVDDHPMEPVGPANWHELAVGYVANPRRGTNSNDDLLFADLIFTTQRGIDAVQNGKRAISVGYNALYEQTAPGLGRQKDIHCNHVALVDEGRCGARCCIMDGKTVYTADLYHVQVQTPAGKFNVGQYGEVYRYREGYHNPALEVEKEFSRPEWLTDLPQPDIDFPSDDEQRPAYDEDIDYTDADFEEGSHPRGQPKNAGQFAKGAGQKGGEQARETSGKGREAQGKAKEAQGKAVEASRKPVEAAHRTGRTETTVTPSPASQSAPKAAAGGVGKLTPTQQRAYTGQQVATKTQLSKQETGAIGEQVIQNYLKQFAGMQDARPLNMKESNFPVDLIGDHELIEIKTGLVSNSPSAQKWRATIGQPGKAEAAWLATASPEEKAAWNQQKLQAIMDRKMKVLQEYQQQYGDKVKGRTITAIINPDTRTADLFQYDGFHLHIRWNNDAAKQAYAGSYTY